MAESKSIFDGTLIALPQKAAAKALGIKQGTLLDWERAGKITGSRPGGKVVLYMVDDLRRLARTGSAKVVE